MTAARAIAAAAAMVAVLQHAPSALAQACGRPDLLHAWPPDKAAGVPTDARLHARYALSADYLGEDVTLQRDGFPADTVTPSWNGAERILSITPPEGLVAGDEYTVTWPRLRGIGTASKGRDAEVTFTVGDSGDTETPKFRGLTGIDWDIDRESDDCTDSLEERFVFDLDLTSATDDGGAESLQLLVFQTRGPRVGSEGAPEAILVTKLPTDGDVRVKRTIGDGTGRVCFAAIVRDLTGKVSASASEEVCTKTIPPPFFQGCSVGRDGSPRSWMLAAVGLVAALRRRRRKGA